LTQVSLSTPAQDRIATVDILRGFALFGILVVNITTFRSANPAWRGIDRGVDYLILILFQSKFMALYSFLFGLSLALFMRKSADRSALWLFAWRSTLLLLMGAAHYILLWDGDILMEYALAAFLLLPFARRSARTVLYWGVGMYAFYAILMMVVVVLAASRPQPQAASADPLVMPVALLQTARYLPLLQWRAGGIVDFLGEHFAAAIFLLGIFLLGMYAGKANILAEPAAHVGLFKRVMVWGLPIGLVCSSITALVGPVLKDLPVVERALAALAITLAPITLALSYAAGAAWLACRVRWLHPLAAPGRMSLTNYLMQSLILTTLFYPYGLGWWDRVSPVAGLALAVVIYASQVVLSNWWLKYFRFGPMEWLWRSLTYRRVQPMGLAAHRKPGETLNL
jgi:uncharacterized protein